MTNQTVAFLRDFNRWRRGDDSIPQPQPGKASQMIDAACDQIEMLEREVESLRQSKGRDKLAASNGGCKK